jgi:hypothetical protein
MKPTKKITRITRKKQKKIDRKIDRKIDGKIDEKLNVMNTEKNIFNSPSVSNHSFNSNKFIRESHNCYTYFLNLKSLKAYNQCKKDLDIYNYCDRPQPGRRAGYKQFKKTDFNCKEVMKRTGADNPKMIQLKSIEQSCPDDFYKGAVVVAPGRDYHYYRLNKEGYWTHKPGYKPSTAYDSKGLLISDPKKARRDYGGTLNYTDFCGYTCLPNNPYLKDMSMIPSENKNVDKTQIKKKNINITPNLTPYIDEKKIIKN